MKRERPKAPADIQELLALIKAGRLFEVQAWIREGKRVMDPQNEHSQFCPLFRSVEMGFHSLVVVILQAAEWPPSALQAALSLALERKRIDLVGQLRSRCTSVATIDFELVCRTVDPELIEEFLRAGADPARDNGFARALVGIKARPLLRFYRSLRAEFPVLDAQAALALWVAVNQGQPGWAAMLRWAGADPFMRVPGGLSEEWNDTEERHCSAAEEACYKRDAALLKVLHLKPSPKQALELLDCAALFASSEVIKELLKFLTPSELNEGEPPSCKAVEKVLCQEWAFFASPSSAYDYEVESVKSLELMFDAGACWHPDREGLKAARKALRKLAASQVVRVLRLLIHIPGAADLASVNELGAMPEVREKVASQDKPLLKDLDQLKIRLKASDVGASAKRGRG